MVRRAEPQYPGALPAHRQSIGSIPDLASPGLGRRVDLPCRLRHGILVLLASLLGPATAGATTYVVDPGGGGDATTFQGGVNAMAATASADDETLRVLPGFYDEDVSFPELSAWIIAPGGPSVTQVRRLVFGPPSTRGRIWFIGLGFPNLVDATGGVHKNWIDCRFEAGLFVGARPTIPRLRIVRCEFRGRTHVENWFDLPNEPGFEECRFIGAPFFYRNGVDAAPHFVRCSFEGPADSAVFGHLTGDTEHRFIGCTFRSVGHGIVVRPQSGGERLVVRDSRFEDVAGDAIHYFSFDAAPFGYVPPGLIVERTTFEGCGSAVRWLEPYPHAVRLASTVIEGCSRNAVEAMAGGPSTIDSVVVRGGAGDGIVLATIPDPMQHRIRMLTIRRSIVTGNGGDGIVVVDPQTPADREPTLFELNTSALNGGDGIRYAAAADDPGPAVSIRNNLTAGNQGIGIHVIGTPLGPLHHNDSWNNIVAEYEGVPLEDNLVMDPGFCDVPAGDFHLQSASPCAPSGPFGQIGALGVGCDASRVAVDVRIGEQGQPLAVGSSQTVPFAILSNAVFDAMGVDAASVTLAGAPTVNPPGKRNRESRVDVDGDGRLDLVLAVNARDMELERGDQTVTMDGLTRSGLRIVGTDQVRVVGRPGPLERHDRTADPTLETAAPVAFAIERLWPNPSREGPQLSFALPAAGDARVEVLDVAGRRVWSRDLGALGPGSHHVKLGGRLAVGIYLARVSVGAESRTLRFAVTE